MPQKVYLDDNGDPIGTGTGSYLDDQGNPIGGAARGSALEEAAGGFGEEANPITIAKGIYGMLPIPEALGGSGIIGGPLGAVTGIARAHAGEAVKTYGAAKELLQSPSAENASKMVGHAAATVLPVVGPVAAGIGEEIGETGNVARGVGRGLGLIATLAAPKAVPAAIRGAARVAGAVAPEGVAAGLEAGAAGRVADVMTPRANTNVGRRMGNKALKIAPELAKDAEITGNWSRQGMAQAVEAKLADAATMLDEANDARLSARTFDTQPIIDDLVKKRREYVAEPVEASQITPKEVVDPKAAAEVGAHNASVAQADRRFAVQWFADDLKEMPFQQGGSTPGQRAAAFENFRPGDSEASKYAIGAGTGRVPGTPTQQMFHALGINGSRGEIFGRLERYLKGSPDPKLDKLGSLLVEAFNGETFDWSKLSDAQIAELGPNVTRAQLRSPITMPNPATTRADVMARWFPEAVEFDQMPLSERPMPAPEKVGVPVGKSFLPGPASDRVRVIDEAIAGLRRLGPAAKYEDIRKIRQAYDQPAKTVYSPAVTPDFLKVKGVAEGAADVTGTLREHLARMDPQTAAANAQYSLYKGASDILKAAEEIERVRPKVGRQIMARLTGSILGQQSAGVPGAIAGYLLGPMADSMINAGVTTKLQTAKLMQQLAGAVRKGDLGRVVSLEARLRALVRAGTIGKAAASPAAQPAGSTP